MINLAQKNYLNKSKTTFYIVIIALTITKPIIESIKPIFKQKYNYLAKNGANKKAKS